MSVRSLTFAAAAAALLAVPVSAAEKQALTFAWDAPAEATVTELSNARGSQVIMTYKLSVAPGQTPDSYVVARSDFDFLSLDNKPVTQPGQKARLALDIGAQAVVPTMNVGADGKIASFNPFDFKAVYEELASIGRAIPELRAAVEDLRVMKDRQQLNKNRAIEDWRVSVENWLGTNMAPGESIVEHPELEFDSITVKGTVTTKHEGKTDDCADCIKLSLTAVYGGDGMRQAMINYSIAAGVEREQIEKQVAGFEKVSEVVLITSVSTMRPELVTVRSINRLLQPGGQSQEQVERRTMKFDWK